MALHDFINFLIAYGSNAKRKIYFYTGTFQKIVTDFFY